jgi:hypothetical protein
MTRRRDIGEFKFRHFVISIVTFVLIGGFLYSRFDFYVAPKNPGDTSEQNKIITNLEERISNVEKMNANLRSEINRLEGQIRDCQKANGSKKKPSNCPNH